MICVINNKFVKLASSIALFVCALHCFGEPISEGLYMFAFGVLFTIALFLGFGVHKAYPREIQGAYCLEMQDAL